MEHLMKRRKLWETRLAMFVERLDICKKIAQMLDLMISQRGLRRKRHAMFAERQDIWLRIAQTVEMMEPQWLLRKGHQRRKSATIVDLLTISPR